MTTKRNAKQTREFIVNQIAAEYMAQLFGYITPLEASLNVIEILESAPKGRKDSWTDAVHATASMMRHIEPENISWAIMQHGMIYLAWEI